MRFRFSPVHFYCLPACSDETNTTVVNETGIAQLAKGEVLPDCDSATAGEMLYAVDSGAVYICDENGWQTLNGKDGADGSDGKDGTSGESCEAVALSDGSGYKILCGEGCTVTDDGNGVVSVIFVRSTDGFTHGLRGHGQRSDFQFEWGRLRNGRKMLVDLSRAGRLPGRLAHADELGLGDSF